MQAVLGNGRGTSPQECVTPRSAVAAYDVDLRVRASQLLFNRLEQIKLAGIIGTHIACSMVAQEIVQALQCARNICVSDPVDDIDVLASMGVKQA